MQNTLFWRSKRMQNLMFGPHTLFEFWHVLVFSIRNQTLSKFLISKSDVLLNFWLKRLIFEKTRKVQYYLYSRSKKMRNVTFRMSTCFKICQVVKTSIQNLTACFFKLKNWNVFKILIEHVKPSELLYSKSSFLKKTRRCKTARLYGKNDANGVFEETSFFQNLRRCKHYKTKFVGLRVLIWKSETL